MALNNSEQANLDFGFEAEITASEYSTISGKEQTSVSDLQSITLNEISPGLTYDGVPEIVKFHNEGKINQKTGKKSKGYDSIRVRLVDKSDYLDAYANVPVMDENGFVEKIHRDNEFYRSGFDLIFSFMKYVDETSVLDENGEINYINKVNLMNILEFIDKMNRVEVKVTKGADNGYNSFIIVDME